MPVVCGELMVSLAAGCARLSERAAVQRAGLRGLMPATAICPRRSSGRAAHCSRPCGGTLSCSRRRSAGSFSTPVVMPFSQRSHQRSASCRKPMARAGHGEMRILVDPGPDDALAPAPFRFWPPAAARRWCSRRPSRRPRARRPGSPTEVLADRAVLPEGVAALMPQPVRRTGSGSFSSRSSHMSRQRSPDQRGIGRARRIGRTWSPPSPYSRSAGSRPCSGCRRHSGRRWSTMVMTAFSAGGLAQPRPAVR